MSFRMFFLTLLTCLAIVFVAGEASVAQQGGTSNRKFEPTWDSIDQRETPQWWRDAKFGIFIHWGPYSVPAFSKVGQYSEWYWRNLVEPKRASHGHAETVEYHLKNYGEGFTYPDFVPMFNCNMFDADQWAGIFKESGAKYVVLTSKHHDGYCLWPSKEADESWGRPWNSVTTGPRRDLVGELTDAVRKTDVKMGLYYSLYEWYNPLYVADANLYVKNVMLPQVKDIVTKYAPAVLFSDGEWDYPDKVWRSEELLSWIYNEAPSRDEIVLNDRWNGKKRHQHGDYYTTEYGAGFPNADHAWEENRGMAYSFGFSKTENYEDYNSTQKLIYMLVDIVSRGGTFLLDIGPTADGRIPVIMQERLLEIGDWLDINGEAIYGTQTWTSTCQWSEGEKQTSSKKRYGYDVMKLTLNPPEGAAAKEIFFTRKGKTLYCICAALPDEQLVVKGVTASTGAQITMLGRDETLNWKQEGSNIVITLPRLNPSKLPCHHAWTFKISQVETP